MKTNYHNSKQLQNPTGGSNYKDKLELLNLQSQNLTVLWNYLDLIRLNRENHQLPQRLPKETRLKSKL
jgi:hypothetical protein